MLLDLRIPKELRTRFSEVWVLKDLALSPRFDNSLLTSYPRCFSYELEKHKDGDERIVETGGKHTPLI